MDVDQKDRGAEFITPLGANTLALTNFNFSEELSAEFYGSVDCISDNFVTTVIALLSTQYKSNTYNLFSLYKVKNINSYSFLYFYSIKRDVVYHPA